MVYLRSISRFILISLALLGLSVSSANAAVVWDNGGPDNSDAYSFIGGFGNTFAITDDFTLAADTTVTNIELWLYRDVGTNFAGLSVMIDTFAATIDGRTETLAEDDPFGLGLGRASYIVDIDISDIDLGSGLHSLTIGDDSGQFPSAWMMTGVNGEILPSLSSPLINGNETGDGQTDTAFRIIGDVDDASPVPVPPTIWLFGTALIGLVGFTRRKSRLTI